MDEGYICHCREGFYDESPNPQETGRLCLEFVIDARPTQVPPAQEPRKEGIPCGRNEVCSIPFNEVSLSSQESTLKVCIDGYRCGCRPGESRRAPGQKCARVEEVPVQVRVVSRDKQPLVFSSEYGGPQSPPYVEFVHLFEKELGRTIGGTQFAPRYVNTAVQ